MIEILHCATHQLGVGMRGHLLNHAVLFPSADDHADIGASGGGERSSLK